MNKQKLWYISLFSIILILCIYYISIPSNIFESVEPTISESVETIEVNESSDLVGLRVENDETVLAEIENLQGIIVDNTKSVEEKNLAYEQLKTINQNKGRQEEIENLIKKEFNYDSFVKIDNDQISIIIKEKNHNKELANNIIKRVQSLFNDKKYITVKFN
ncbi:MAG: SpoIIIAH-like family protein [Bacilli bacterium]|nr:SpoIIIAH-like family protein [Bacilli bacterium]